MYILSLVVLLAGVLQGCANQILTSLAVPLLYSSLGLGLNTLESSVMATATEAEKISQTQLAQLQPGMTKQEVKEILRKSPEMVDTQSDGSSTATYIYSKRDRTVRGVTTYFTKSERESQTVMIKFDPAGRYVTHTISESRVCGSAYTGMSADNCGDQKTAGVN